MNNSSGPQLGIAARLPTSHPFRKRYQLRDVWNAMATEESFDYVFWIHITLDILIDNGIRYFGYVLVVMAVILITFLGLSGLGIVLPKVATPGSLSFYFQFVVGKCVLICPYFSFISHNCISILRRLLHSLLYLFQLLHGSYNKSRCPTRF